MAVIQPTPDHVLDEATREALKRVNTTAVIDVLARNGYDARYTYMFNLKTMNPGKRLVGRAIKIPRVILLVSYDRVPKRRVRFSRFNVFARDKNTCQYCRKRLPRSELNLDHVIPRSKGGMSSWENVVCSCFPCNRKKGGILLEHARMQLMKKPVQPEWTPFMIETFSFKHYQEWLPYLSEVDSAYWNTELER